MSSQEKNRRGFDRNSFFTEKDFYTPTQVFLIRLGLVRKELDGLQLLRLLFPQAIAIATIQPIPVQPKQTLITIVLPLFGIDLWFAIKLGKKYIIAQMIVNTEKASIGGRLARNKLGIAEREIGETFAYS